MPKRRLDPLPSAAFQILLSLTDEDLHGYGIMRQVEQQTSGRMRLGPGTLYSSIQALLEDSLIEEVDRSGERSAADERRDTTALPPPVERWPDPKPTGSRTCSAWREQRGF